MKCTKIYAKRIYCCCIIAICCNGYLMITNLLDSFNIRNFFAFTGSSLLLYQISLRCIACVLIQIACIAIVCSKCLVICSIKLCCICDNGIKVLSICRILLIHRSSIQCCKQFFCCLYLIGILKGIQIILAELRLGL